MEAHSFSSVGAGCVEVRAPGASRFASVDSRRLARELSAILQAHSLPGENLCIFSESTSEKLILTRAGDLRNFRAQPVSGAVLASLSPL